MTDEEILRRTMDGVEFNRSVAVLRAEVKRLRELAIAQQKSMAELLTLNRSSLYYRMENEYTVIARANEVLSRSGVL